MKAALVYDSVYGNTEKAAMAIAAELKATCDIRVLRATEVDPSALERIDLLIVGSPTQWNKALKTIRHFLGDIPPMKLLGVQAMVFDTRLPSKFVGALGYAAGKMAAALKKKGAKIVSINGFLVAEGGMKIQESELARAAEWGRSFGR